MDPRTVLYRSAYSVCHSPNDFAKARCLRHVPCKNMTCPTVERVGLSRTHVSRSRKSETKGMTSFIRESDNPLHPARFQHLAERMFGICEQRGWKHDELPEGNRPFQFWPWGADR